MDGRSDPSPALTADPFIPAIAIVGSTAAVATFAAFVIDGHRVDTIVWVVAGYGLQMIIGEARLLPANRWLSFMLTFWAFYLLLGRGRLRWIVLARCDPSDWMACRVLRGVGADQRIHRHHRRLHGRRPPVESALPGTTTERECRFDLGHSSRL